ncbi:glycosyltransferase family 39 protein [Devosia sp. Root413D1]|uniref:glycosyltransferase family 39 protein n=1 Tax=Devosia sp. Root413D1 TaxID=1736531 RepID=UPI00138F78CA|nr:glycosyltransferase family 39 protein [Devosia sp. Root413D1]
MGAEVFALVVVLASLVAKAYVALSVGLDGDEAYYALWSAYLSPGYLDHPPAVALMTALGRLIGGDTLLGVRLLPLLAGIAVLAALYRTGRLLVPGRSAAALAVAWYCISLQGAVNFVATPDAPSTLFWTLSLWAAAEAVARSRPNWWLAVGLLAGAGLASKYTNAWFGIGLVLFLIGTADGRRQFGRWQLWAGGLLALLVFAPVLWWNYQHDWRSFLFQGARVVSFEEAFGRLVSEFVISQAAAMGPVLLLCALLAMGGFFLGYGRRAGARLALPVLTTLPLLAYFLVHALHARVEVNWLQPVAPVLALLGAAFVCLLPARPFGRWIVAVGSALQLVFGLALIGFAYVQAVYHPLDLGYADRTRMLRGWDKLAAEIRQLAEETGAQVIWTEGNYRLTGELFFYGRAAGDSRPVRDIAPHPRYDFLPPEARYPTSSPALLVESVRSPAAAEALPPRAEFSNTRLVTVLKRDEGAGRGEEYYAVLAVSGATGALPRAD